MSIISLMQYIAEYCNILQCSTIGLRTQSKYASIILKIFSAVTHNTHVDDTKHQLNTISNNRNVFVGHNRNTVFQYRATLVCMCKIINDRILLILSYKCATNFET